MDTDELPVVPHIQGGKLRGLAVTTAKRWYSLPDIPALGDTVPGYNVELWFGAMVPAGTPAAVVQQIKDKGAPIEAVTPSFTTGVEMGIYLSTKAKHPNAAKLAIHYALTREGSKVQSSDPGSVDVFDPVGLPKDYQSPNPDTPTFYDQIGKLLGK